MKKTLITCCSLVLLSPAIFSQTTTTTTVQSNGVVIQEAVGVEGVVVKCDPQVVSRSMNDWNLAECIDAMRFLEIKLIEAPESEKEKYQSAKIVLQGRIDTLTSTK